MKQFMILAVMVAMAVPAGADTFGTGDNAFNIDFVPISGSTNPTSGYGIVANDYRMGTYEITNDQWTKFKAAYGAPTGNDWGYSFSPYWGSQQPTNEVSWYEAAQFVNYLNTSKGYQAAYKFTGALGTRNYTFEVWQQGDTGYNASNPFRNSNAFYFLPTENEWVKAAYWNGTNLQAWATIGNVYPMQGDGENGGWNYDGTRDPWNVGSGSQELNGTYDMMGNVWEWMESPWYTGDYTTSSFRGMRGGAYSLNLYYDYMLRSSYRSGHQYPYSEYYNHGFRIASIPEPCTLLLLGVGGMTLRRKK